MCHRTSCCSSDRFALSRPRPYWTKSIRTIDHHRLYHNQSRRCFFHVRNPPSPLPYLWLRNTSPAPLTSSSSHRLNSQHHILLSWGKIDVYFYHLGRPHSLPHPGFACSWRLWVLLCRSLCVWLGRSRVGFSPLLLWRRSCSPGIRFRWLGHRRHDWLPGHYILLRILRCHVCLLNMRNFSSLTLSLQLHPHLLAYGSRLHICSVSRCSQFLFKSI